MRLVVEITDIIPARTYNADGDFCSVCEEPWPQWEHTLAECFISLRQRIEDLEAALNKELLKNPEGKDISP